MTYCAAEDLKQLTGIKPEHLRLEKEDVDGLDAILNDWILQAKGLIDSYCHTNFDNDIPAAVENVCLRLAANMVALSQTRKGTPLIKVNDWKVGISSSAIFTQDLKDDLKDGNFVVDKSNKSDSIDFFAITGD
jgi:hypothetical protein